MIDPTNAVVDTADNWEWSLARGVASNYCQHGACLFGLERIGVVPDSPTAWATYARSYGLKHSSGSNGNHVHGTPGSPNWATTVTMTPSPTTTSTPTPSTYIRIHPVIPLSVSLLMKLAGRGKHLVLHTAAVRTMNGSNSTIPAQWL